MKTSGFRFSALVGVVGATVAALAVVGSAAAAVAPATLANATSGGWSRSSVYLCAPGSGTQPTNVAGDSLVSALTSGSTYANSISGSVAGQLNATGSAALSCAVPSGATPILDASGVQMVADGNGGLYPSALAGNGTIGYPAYTAAATAAGASTLVTSSVTPGSSTASTLPGAATILANASSGGWSGSSVFLCTQGAGAQPAIVTGDSLVTALTGGSTYADSISGSVAGQANNIGSAALSCSVPSGAKPILDATGSQMVADNNGDLFPNVLAGLGSIGYPAYTAS
jgi:hypothetical protein